MPIFARNVVATSQPLAAQAGLQMMIKGGDAVDAALATAIALTVVNRPATASEVMRLCWFGATVNYLG